MAQQSKLVSKEARFMFDILLAKCKIGSWDLAWPFSILQNDNTITISWDFLRLTAPAAMPGHLGAVSLTKSHNIVISSFCDIVKGQAMY